MSKASRRNASNKRLQALIRAQKMNELMQIGGVQSQALLDSAGESRPSDESHVVELLDTEKFPRSEAAKVRPRIRRARTRSRIRRVRTRRVKRTAAKKKRRR